MKRVAKRIITFETGKIEFILIKSVAWINVWIKNFLLLAFFFSNLSGHLKTKKKRKCVIKNRACLH